MNIQFFSCSSYLPVPVSPWISIALELEATQVAGQILYAWKDYGYHFRKSQTLLSAPVKLEVIINTIIINTVLFCDLFYILHDYSQILDLTLKSIIQTPVIRAIFQRFNNVLSGYYFLKMHWVSSMLKIFSPSPAMLCHYLKYFIT